MREGVHAESIARNGDDVVYSTGSVSTWGQRRAHNLNAPATLYPLESSLQADFLTKASTPERRNSPQRKTLSLTQDLIE